MNKERWITLAGVRRERSGEIAARASITADSPFFSGHFPGRPILPGLALLAMVEQAIVEQPGPADRIRCLTGLRCVRFRRVIESCASFAIRLSPHEQYPDTDYRFQVMTDDGYRACDGIAATGGSPPAFDPAGSAGLVIEEPASSHLPHRDRMKLVDTLVEVGEGCGVCRAKVRAEWPLVGPAGASGAVLVEVAAQSAAATVGWKMRQDHQEVGVAFLVGIKHACWSPAPIPVGTELLTHVAPVLRHDDYLVFRARVLAPEGHPAEVVFQSFRAPG
jgi:3-hydroxymyristoyl/3-hydroxydecanoyl-(acyl carrier protein) dehydratase